MKLLLFPLGFLVVKFVIYLLIDRSRSFFAVKDVINRNGRYALAITSMQATTSLFRAPFQKAIGASLNLTGAT